MTDLFEIKAHAEQQALLADANGELAMRRLWTTIAESASALIRMEHRAAERAAQQ
jgi:hypothetical protein